MSELTLNIKTKDFGKAQNQLGRLAKRLPGAVSQSMAYEAVVLAGDIRRGIRSGAPGGQRFRPLAKSTIRMKKSSKPLIHNADLIRSIKSEKVSQDRYETTYFVGVNRNERNRKGDSLANIAEIHEFGTRPYKIQVTPKMRRFWFAMFRAGVFVAPLSPKKTVIHHPGIPARPFLRPTFDVWKKDAEKRIVRRIGKRLNLTA